MMLADRDALDLDAPVIEYFPGMRVLTVRRAQSPSAAWSRACSVTSLHVPLLLMAASRRCTCSSPTWSSTWHAPPGPGCPPVRLPADQPPPGQHGMDQLANAQHDHAEGQRGERGGHHRLAVDLRGL
jgi:hypothetical protein